MSKERSEAAALLGALGGAAKTPRKRAAVRANLEKARKVLAMTRKKRLTRKTVSA